MKPVSVELCAGAGGQALGLEWAGIGHAALVEVDPDCCSTLRQNRPAWNVIEGDLSQFDGTQWKGVDLLAGGLPCPPFSRAGKQLGERDERNLFPAALQLVDLMRPAAVMFENVKGFLDPPFAPLRERICAMLKAMGYEVQWRCLAADDFGVPQRRSRVVLIGLRRGLMDGFGWPDPHACQRPSVGETLADLMAEEGWEQAEEWARQAAGPAPTLVGGSRKHGGADLGPAGTRRRWAQLGVDGRSVADRAPPAGFSGMPRLTLRMGARLQGFPDEWQFCGRKTAAWRQIGNALPPPVAQAVGECLVVALGSGIHLGWLPQVFRPVPDVRVSARQILAHFSAFLKPDTGPSITIRDTPKVSMAWEYCARSARTLPDGSQASDDGNGKRPEGTAGRHLVITADPDGPNPKRLVLWCGSNGPETPCRIDIASPVTDTFVSARLH